MINVVSYFLNENRWISFFGILIILLVAFIFSEHKNRIRGRLIFSALCIQFLLAFFILKTVVGKKIFFSLARGFESLYMFTSDGINFVFGKLADANGPWGAVFLIKVLPTIIFFGALMALLFHLGIVQIIVKALSIIIRPILGTSGAETLSVAANSMLGQTEAPLLIKHYLPSMTRSEMLVVMIGGMSHLSGSLLAVYGSMGVPMKHLLSSTIIAIPGAILISKILIPETQTPVTSNQGNIEIKSSSKNVLDAISTGTGDGLRLAANVAAMLIAFISLMAMINSILLATVGFSLDAVFAKVFYGVAYMIGIAKKDCDVAASLLGQKLVINEFVAYSNFIKSTLTERSKEILTYALAGFSNFSCIGIQIGGIGAICPEKRLMLTQLGFKALLGGTLTNLLNAALIGLFV
jgi:concentrative nucleoside transporter, CNT family